MLGERCCTVLFGVWLSASVASQGAPVDGSVSPVDTWYTQGGCASRSGATLTPPVVGDLAPAWSFEAKGTIESEPLVWNRSVFVASRDTKGRAWIEWVDLETGERVAKKNFKTDVSLDPSIWRNRLVVRSGRKKLSFFRLSKGAITKINDYRAQQELSAPLLFETDVFVFEGDAMVSLKSGRSSANWRRPGRFRGRPSLYGDMVYGLQYSPGGEVHLLQVDRVDGEVRRKRIAGAYPGVPGFDQEASVQIFDGVVLAHHAAPVQSSSGQSFRAAYWASNADQPALIDCLVPMVQAQGKCLGFLGGDPGGLQHLELSSSARKGSLLALPGKRPKLFEDIVAPSLAGGGVAYLGSMALDVVDYEVLWRIDGRTRFPLVPARDTVLVVRGDATLVALCNRDLSRAEVQVLASPTSAHRIATEALILRNGDVLDGDCEVDWEAATVQHGASTIPFADVLLMLDDEGRLLIATTGSALDFAVRGLGMARAAPAYAALGQAGVTTKDAVFLARIAAKARAMGAEDDSLLNLEKRVEAWSNKPLKNIDKKTVAALEEREREVERIRANTAFELLQGLGDVGSERLKLELLRITLRESGDHEEAFKEVWKRVALSAAAGVEAGEGELVRGILARDREQPSAKRALGWIEYLLVADAHPTSFYAPPQATAGLTKDQRALGRATTRWRKDLVGASSGDLRILTPLADPEVLAQCLATGHLVTSKLDEMFALEGATGDGRPPLTLYLYESQEEYQAQSAKRGEGEEGATKYRAGHYSVQDNLQHVYMPSDKDARDRVLRTYAHELTHNWAQMRCPLYEVSELDLSNLHRAGYWIVEGLARFVQEFRYDFEVGLIDPFNPRAGCFDTLANARALHNWKNLYGLSGATFASLKHEPRHSVPLEWRLGHNAALSDASLFYAQAAATVHYLYHAEKGRYRERLLRYVAAYYTGKDARLDIQEAFGISGIELGERVEAFSREMLAQG